VTSREHLVHGHREGAVQPLEFRVVTSAHEAPIDPPYGKRRWFTSLDEPELLTRHVSQSLGPAILQRVGIVIYRASEPEARRAETELHALLDPLFAEPVETYVERWNEDLELWQPPEKAGGDKATVAALRWEVRIRCRDRNAAREIASQIRDHGEVMVGWSLRDVLIAVPDEPSARTFAARFPELAGADIRVRPLTRFRRRRLLGNLYDRRRRPNGGWLQYEEPSPG
jgi:hypothetical protein